MIVPARDKILRDLMEHKVCRPKSLICGHQRRETWVSRPIVAIYPNPMSVTWTHLNQERHSSLSWREDKGKTENNIHFSLGYNIWSGEMRKEMRKEIAFWRLKSQAGSKGRMMKQHEYLSRMISRRESAKSHAIYSRDASEIREHQLRFKCWRFRNCSAITSIASSVTLNDR